MTGARGQGSGVGGQGTGGGGQGSGVRGQDAAVLDALAVLLCYPRAGFDAAVAACRARVPAECAEAAAGVEAFAAAVTGRPVSELEELYTQTFDFDPKCTLEIGWHLFGEEYERGAFLVRLRGMLRERGIAESGELPDHLSHVLPLLARLDAAEAGRLAGSCVLPALEKVLAALAGRDNPYEHLLGAVRSLLAEEGAGAPFNPAVPEGDGSRSAAPAPGAASLVAAADGRLHAPVPEEWGKP